MIVHILKYFFNVVFLFILARIKTVDPKTMTLHLRRYLAQVMNTSTDICCLDRICFSDWRPFWGIKCL